MAEERSPFELRSRGALADGAARLEALASEVKSRQAAQCQGPMDFVRQSVSPDEAWSRNYMTQGIGPQVEVAPVTGIALAPPMPAVSIQLPPTPGPVEPVAAKAVIPAREAAGDIGAHLGRPRPRRSWISRLVRPGSWGAA